MLPYKVMNIEQFSFECRKVIGFAFTTPRDWFKKLAPLFHPIRSKTKTNRDSLARVSPHFASATRNYFVFWSVHLIICVLCDWLEWLLWFWFYDTQLKTTLKQTKLHDIIFLNSFCFTKSLSYNVITLICIMNFRWNMQALKALSL